MKLGENPHKQIILVETVIWVFATSLVFYEGFPQTPILRSKFRLGRHVGRNILEKGQKCEDTIQRILQDVKSREDLEMVMEVRSSASSE
ncbi:hypothetical protein K432DRAFT_383407 [Lepidopterella palustris CBS 459.81]|uniref:Uncharacterized protein n=1 Tax=Lepidopterella palustris CBS 459.81 TaxID=1314670 RepID=A0A8E2E7W5_9PEZI|nr:hypothetical protein K432DRAFT_383407 [Lepidopterella palustris CBS 459.81]